MSEVSTVRADAGADGGRAAFDALVEDVTRSYALQEKMEADAMAAACRLIARARDGRKGVWAYRAFDHINATYWAGSLPTPLILWLITPYGKCLGDTRCCTPALIRLHPGLVGGPTETPWGIAPEHRGYGYAYEVLLHECIHLAIFSGLVAVPSNGKSHDDPAWIAEVNRLAPLLGLHIVAGRSKPKRVPIEGTVGKRGKPLTKPARVDEGTVPYEAITRFPHGVRQHLGCMDWYAAHRWWVPPEARGRP